MEKSPRREKAGITAEVTVPIASARKCARLTDKLASVCTEDKWKHFVGKKTKSPYVSHEGREAYKKVMQFTNVDGRKVRAIYR